MSLRGTENYVWATSNVLGKGITGTVYQGVNKHNGESVAVKTFNQFSQMRPRDVQMREFDVLRKVCHENIVKLLAIEEEQENRGKVIVMELCSGGSLFSVLDDPEYAFGLNEIEFFKVLANLSAGMKHLRDHSLVHRDLKPGNIMRFIGSDGSVVYKLADFGAARVLDDDQQFASLYGTEEYLHPDMYERAVLRKSASKAFDASVDLWSIGVTLYHVATGHLPFRPYGGRKNKEMLHVLTTQKCPGVISGVQTTDGGEVEWSSSLPDSCQLSKGAKILVTPLLAGLLEANTSNQWTFEQFFDRSTQITNSFRVPVFYCNWVQLLNCYLPNDMSTVGELKQALTTQLCDATEQLVLTVNCRLLDDDARAIKHIAAFESSSLTKTSPIFAYSRSRTNVVDKFSSTHILPRFCRVASSLNLENDALVSKSLCGIAYEYSRHMSTKSLHCQLMDQAVISLTTVINETIDLLIEKLKVFQKTIAMANTHSVLLENMCLGCDSRLSHKALLAELNSCYDNALSCNLFEQTKCDIQAAYVCSQLMPDWRERTHTLIADLTSHSKCCYGYVKRVRDGWQRFMRDRSSRNLTYNDEQFHLLEKVKVNSCVSALQELHERRIVKPMSHCVDIFSEWFKVAQTQFVKAEIVGTYLSEMQQLTDGVCSTFDTQIEKFTSLNIADKSIEDIQGSIWSALHENESLVSHLQTLTNVLMQNHFVA